MPNPRRRTGLEGITATEIPPILMTSTVSMGISNDEKPSPKQIGLRREFPETWLWHLYLKKNKG
jgi:hypothetical protein